MSIAAEPENVDPEVGRPERRWPMALAVVVALALHLLLPADFRINPPWLYSVSLAILLVVIVAGDPGLIDEERGWMRYLTNAMIVIIALANLWAAIRLAQGVLDNAPFDNAIQLLQIGGIIWTCNVIAFALWFWDVDGGGAAKRATHGAWSDPAFLFPEMSLENYVAAGWYPRFADYLTLSFYTATAFSPTDVSCIKRWSKLVMVLESASSLCLVTLVFARAINGLSS